VGEHYLDKHGILRSPNTCARYVGMRSSLGALCCKQLDPEVHHLDTTAGQHLLLHYVCTIQPLPSRSDSDQNFRTPACHIGNGNVFYVAPVCQQLTPGKNGGLLGMYDGVILSTCFLRRLANSGFRHQAHPEHSRCLLYAIRSRPRKRVGLEELAKDTAPVSRKATLIHSSSLMG
jgi:hypothetical protein